MELSTQQIKLLTELNVRYECVIADVSIQPHAQRLSDQQLGDLIKRQCEKERDCFAQKHKISSTDIKHMEDAYRQLNDLEEYHQFLDYQEVCSHVFYDKLQKIIMSEVSFENESIAKSIIPYLLRSHNRYKKEVERRIKRCSMALRMSIPNMSVYNYERIKYRLNYKIDHDKLKEEQYENSFMRELCQDALCEWYFKSYCGRIISFLYKLFSS